MDLVEAAVRSGRPDEAAAHVAAMKELKLAGLGSRQSLLVAGSSAMVGSAEDGFERFEEALGLPDSGRWPFDRARIELAYGERLRRARAMTEARSHLAAAWDVFDRLRASEWVERAANELRATGQTRVRGVAGSESPLTPQEFEIATLAASGLSNKEIAKRMFLSPRTVAAHLYRAFPKLGVSSRAGLRDALDSLPAELTPKSRS
jgi:DNA-binding CsgD family transcriptional regulator